MSLIINLRGTNGSGKSTAARGMLRHSPPLHEDIQRQGWNVTVMGVNCLTDGRTLLIGNYPEGKTGGCDRVKTFELMRGAIRRASDSYPIIIFEGITVSTVFGSWADFCQQEPFWWVYLNTPLHVCIERVKLRNGGADFNEEMVADKYRAISATRLKAIDAGFQVVDLHWADSINGLQTLALLGT